MDTRQTDDYIRRIDGASTGLAWLGEIASVYTNRALHMKWHSHDSMEVTFCLKGVMPYEISGGRGVELKPGTALVIPAHRRHRLSSGVDAPSRRVSLLLRDCAGGLGVFTKDDVAAMLSSLAERKLRPIGFSRRTMDSLLRLGAFLHGETAPSPRDMCEIRILASMIAFDIAGAAMNSSPSGEALMMEEAFAWLERNCARDVSISELVAYMGYGRTKFFELFKEHTGLSPNDYLVRLRIAKARELLSAGGLSVSEVSEKVGFSDPAFFSRTFRRLVGYPPSSLIASAVRRS